MALDLVQSVAYVAFAAYGASGVSGTQDGLTADLATYLNGGTAPDGSSYNGFLPWFNSADYGYKLIGGDWNVVWGPVVIPRPSIPSSYAANSMYVAYSKSQQVYVVAVAGTNFDSLYDWFDEDGNVAPADMVGWPLGLPSAGAKISGATYTGITNLLGMRDSSGVSLPTFLEGAPNPGDSTLVFAGHSLGGALAPTLALNLYPDPAASGWSNVYVLALAGPTPGNKQFAEAFNSAYPQVASGGGAYPYWNTNYQNFADIVPRAWNRMQSVAPLPSNGWSYFSIWGKLDFGLKLEVQLLIEAINLLVRDAEYWRINSFIFTPDWGYFDPGSISAPAPGQGWPYPPQWPTWSSLPMYGVTNPLSSPIQLEPLIDAAHVDQYYKYFGLMPIPHFPLSAEQEARREVSKRKKKMLVAAARLRSIKMASEEQVKPAEAADDQDG